MKKRRFWFFSLLALTSISSILAQNVNPSDEAAQPHRAVLPMRGHPWSLDARDIAVAGVDGEVLAPMPLSGDHAAIDVAIYD